MIKSLRDGLRCKFEMVDELKDFEIIVLVHIEDVELNEVEWVKLLLCCKLLVEYAIEHFDAGQPFRVRECGIMDECDEFVYE